MKSFIKKSIPFALVLALMISVISCNKDKVDDSPELPPWESLFIDFSDFADEPNQLKAIIPTYDNFLTAFMNIAFWNSFTSVTMALPSAAYLNILMSSGNPEYLGENSWQWTNEFEYQQVTYVAILTTKRITNEAFSMEMKIAFAALPDQGKVWFDGVCRYDHTYAEWNLYRSETTQVKVVEVEWSRDFETGIKSAKYTYVEPGSAENGSYILYGTSPGAAYDAYYTISVASGIKNIEWFRETGAGRIKDPEKWGNDSWHCWNDLLQDIECPQ
jgi:hypothetical protein